MTINQLELSYRGKLHVKLHKREIRSRICFLKNLSKNIKFNKNIKNSKVLWKITFKTAMKDIKNTFQF